MRPGMAGALAATVPAEAVDALIRGLDEVKAERVASSRDASDQHVRVVAGSHVLIFYLFTPDRLSETA
jgi:hypothetical protein